MTKICFACNTVKSVDEFHRDGVRYKPYCKPCRSTIRKNQSNGRVGKEAEARAHLQARYGITLEDKLDMVKAQNGCCAICKRPSARLDVDHCHSTGIIRGLLCTKCNMGLGLFADNIESLREAIRYLDG